MTTTREAALEAALKLARNRLQACAIDHPTGSREMYERSRWADEATAALSRLSTPATEPQGYVEGPQFRALKTCKGCAHFKSEYWREPSGDGETYDSGTSADCLKDGRSISTYHGSEPAPPDWCPIAARPAPQPAAEHEYPDPLIAEDRYEDDQPAADTPAMNDELATMISDLSHTGELSMPYRLEIADRITALRAIIGTATPAPSDKIAEAAIDRCMQEIEDIICEADVSYPAGRDAGTSIDFDRDAVLAALRAIAGKGE